MLSNQFNAPMHPCLLIIEGFQQYQKCNKRCHGLGDHLNMTNIMNKLHLFFINSYFLKKWRNIMFLQMFHPQTCAIPFVTNWCNSTNLIYLHISVLIHKFCWYNVNSSILVLGNDVISTYKCNTPSKVEEPFSLLKNRCNFI